MLSEKIIFDSSLPPTLNIKFLGDWRIAAGLPSEGEISTQLASHSDVKEITFDMTQMTHWDSGLVSFMLRLIRECEGKSIGVKQETLPGGVQKLLALALKVKAKTASHKQDREPFFEWVGTETLKVRDHVIALLDFIGDITFSFGRLIKRQAFFCPADFMITVQRCGVNALFLVALISMLVGMILAFVGAIQLKLFGAQMYIADMVAIGMVRVMGALMTGILMSGRTGASFAAELGIMQTNEEIDALKTLGVNPVEYLVMPRVLALVLMMPLLTLYADFMGIFGGFIISTTMLGINPVEYLNRTQAAVKPGNLEIGLIHSLVFGIIIAVAACYHGIKCGRSADAVGKATTAGVVSAITSIVIATAIITFICQILGV